MPTPNLKICMKRHPDGPVTTDDFELITTALPACGPGEVLVRNIYLSLDPYMRPMMDPVRSYVPHLNPGDLMVGGTVGVVIESRADELPVGTHVGGRLGWQTHAVAAPSSLRVIDPALGPLSTALGILGMPGVTAHYGLLALGKPMPGETVVVSAASGAVGSVVGQIAKLKGCRVVGIAGGPDKCAYVVDELGFDACIDHRRSDMAEQFTAATPDYVDVSFENVGGAVMDMVLKRLNAHARITLCGMISEYQEQAFGARQPLFEIIRQRATMTGFIISEHLDYWPGALTEIADWLREGKLKYRETISDGLQTAPAAFIGMLTGRNMGKQLVRVGPETGL